MAMTAKSRTLKSTASRKAPTKPTQPAKPAAATRRKTSSAAQVDEMLREIGARNEQITAGIDALLARLG